MLLLACVLLFLFYFLPEQAHAADWGKASFLAYPMRGEAIVVSWFQSTL
jgi:hypothetical protein